MTRWIAHPARSSSRPIRALAAGALAFLLAGPAAAQINKKEPPPDLLGVDVDEKRGGQVPLDLQLMDKDGRAVRLGDYFDGQRPVILSLVYYDCPMLCQLMMTYVARAVHDLKWEIGEDYRVLCVSFDPRNTAAQASAKHQHFAPSTKRAGAMEGWEFLLASTERNAKELSDSVGFSYRYLPDTGEFAHPTVAIVLTPSGTVSNYMYGGYPASYDEKQVRLALQDAADGRLGSVFDRIVWSCYVWDSSRGVYTMEAFAVMRIGGGLTLLALTSLVGGLIWSNRRRSRRAADDSGGRRHATATA